MLLAGPNLCLQVKIQFPLLQNSRFWINLLIILRIRLFYLFFEGVGVGLGKFKELFRVYFRLLGFPSEAFTIHVCQAYAKQT